MTRLEFVEQLVRWTGRYDLVVDAAGADYTDSGANYIINAAQKYLDRQMNTRSGNMKYPFLLSAGDWGVTFPRSRRVRSVWLVDETDDELIRLENTTIEALREKYEAPFDTVDQGQPAYYALDVPGASGYSVSDEMLADSVLEDDTKWSIMPSGITMSGGRITFADVWNGFFALEAGWATALSGAIGETVLVTVVANLSEGDFVVTPWWLPAPSEVVSYVGSATGEETTYTFIVPIAAGSTALGGPMPYLTLGLTLHGTGYIESISAKTITTTFGDLAGLVGAFQRSMVIMPPCDADYTLQIWGDFYSPELNIDSSESFWSVNHPDLLMRACQRELEIMHRNEQGQAAFEATVLKDVKDVRDSFTSEETAGPASQFRMRPE